MPKTRAASMSLTSSPMDVVNAGDEAHRLMTALILAALPNNGAPVPNWSIIDATSAPSTRQILALVLELTIAIEMPRLRSALKMSGTHANMPICSTSRVAISRNCRTRSGNFREGISR